MATNDIKIIGKGRSEGRHQHSNAWEVMKPFVHFSIKAIGAIAHTLIYIVKHIPKPDSLKSEKKSDKIIKI